jgi:ketosteroid isomerase-like protein
MIFFFNCKKEQKENNSEIIDLVNIWNNSHNNKDLTSLSNVYNENVFYYGINKEKSKIIQDKKRLLNKYSDFQQIISDKDLKITNSENGKTISFTKNVTFDSKQKDYPAYLVVSEINGNWKIVTESDLVTDKNIAKPSKTLKIDNPEKIKKGRLYGDFNGDGEKEYAWLENPEMLDPSSSDYPLSNGDFCKGECISTIYFTDKSINPFQIDSYGGYIVNLTDLDNDNSDEIGFWRNNAPHQGGGERQFEIYNIKKGSNRLATTMVHMANDNDFSDNNMVEKLSNNRIKIKESYTDESGMWSIRNTIIELE